MKLDQTLLDLARHMNVAAPPTADVYALIFDTDTQVHLLPAATDRLELMCEAGAIGNRQDADLALRLLALGAPPVSVLADPGTARALALSGCASAPPISRPAGTKPPVPPLTPLLAAPFGKDGEVLQCPRSSTPLP